MNRTAPGGSTGESQQNLTEKLSTLISDPKLVGISFKDDKHSAQPSLTGQRVNNAESNQEDKSPKAKPLESAR